ncbi:DJ-1/PfpI family protein [Clostridium cadaveris]|uniref:DJ-1/PfpI family protein n=1 Tax=Clostridium cadaveris TaxID=1529 RepID=UPI000685CC53|nr:DJ-1/PfpI family protein [Clostridium cadaveris]
MDVVISSTVTGEITGDYNGKAISTEVFSSVDITEYDVVSIIGGSGTIDYLWNNETLINYLKNAHKKNIIITGICAGSVVVAETGLLSGRTGTCYPVDIMKDKVKENGVTYLEQNVVKYDDIITSNGPIGAKDFGNSLLGLFV